MTQICGAPLLSDEKASLGEPPRGVAAGSRGVGLASCVGVGLGISLTILVPAIGVSEDKGEVVVNAGSTEGGTSWVWIGAGCEGDREGVTKNGFCGRFVKSINKMSPNVTIPIPPPQKRRGSLRPGSCAGDVFRAAERVRVGEEAAPPGET